MKVPTIYPLGMSRANCFRTHNELTMYPLGILPFAPSGIGVIPSSLRKVVNKERGTTSKETYKVFAQVEGERRALTSLNGTTGTLPGRGTSRL